ncbi:MAG: DUF1801 domain-containing protein [Phycisphaerae bacterium]
MQSKAKTVAEYLASLPDDRRIALEAVRKVILKNLDKDYEEGMQYGGISYYVPHRIFPPGYHCDPKLPLPFGGLGWQKHHMSVGLMCHYGNDSETSWFQTAWKKTGKKLDMGKCCVRFKAVEDAALEVLGEAVRRIPAAKFIEFYQKWDPRTAAGAEKRDARRAAAKSPVKTAKKSAAKSVKKSAKVAKSVKKKAKR